MSENLPPALSIKDWLDDATRQLVFAGIPSARLDSELLLAHTLRRSRTSLRAHDEELLDPRDYEVAQARLALRLDRVPIAYIIGHKEFYGRPFRVTTATLIPRPESESLIELLTSWLAARTDAKKPLRLIDVGTGSGILGITAKLIEPSLDVTLADISRHALNVAEHNATRLKAAVTTLQSDLLAAYPFAADIIIANLPYVNPDWERSEETNHEPPEALFAQDGGLALIFRLIEESDAQLAAGGILLLEADPEQHDAIIEKARDYGLRFIKQDGYGLLLVKEA